MPIIYIGKSLYDEVVRRGYAPGPFVKGAVEDKLKRLGLRGASRVAEEEPPQTLAALLRLAVEREGSRGREFSPRDVVDALKPEARMLYRTRGAVGPNAGKLVDGLPSRFAGTVWVYLDNLVESGRLVRVRRGSYRLPGG